MTQLYNQSIEELDRPDVLKYWYERRSEIYYIRINRPWEWDGFDKDMNFFLYRDAVYKSYEQAYQDFVKKMLPWCFEPVYSTIKDDHSFESRVIEPIGISYYKVLKILYFKTKVLAEFHIISLVKHTSAWSEIEKLKWSKDFLASNSLLDLSAVLNTISIKALSSAPVASVYAYPGHSDSASFDGQDARDNII